MSESSIFIKECFRDLEAHGVRNKGLVWRRTSPETVACFDFQKSSYSDAYFVNFGVFVRALGDVPANVAPRHCHAYGRIHNDRTEDALDFTAVTRRDRRESLLAIKRDDLLPGVMHCATVAGAVDFLASGKLRVLQVSRVAWKVLQREPRSG